MNIQNIVYNLIIYNNKSINLDEPICKDIILDLKALIIHLMVDHK